MGISDPTLYDGALWAITVDENTEYQRFRAVATMIVDHCSNRLIVLDDATHDRCAALISHMPHVISTAMINELVSNPNRNIAAALAAGSWRDMTRVALTDPNRTRAMVEEDAANVEALLRNMANRLTLMANVLHGMTTQQGSPTAGDDKEMARFFIQGQPFREYKALAKEPDFEERCETVELAIPETGWQQMLLESRVGRAYRAIRRLPSSYGTGAFRSVTRYGRGRVMERSGTGLTVTMVSAGMLTRCSGREPLAAASRVISNVCPSQERT